MKIVHKNAVRGGKGNLLLATLAISVLSLALPIMTLQVYDRILPNPGSGTLPVLITGVCIAVALEFCLRLARGYIINWNGAAFDHRVSCDALSHLLSSDLAVAKKTSPGDYLNRLSAISRMKDFFNGQTDVALFELLLIPVYFALIAYIAGPLVLVPGAVLVAFLLIAIGFGEDLREDLHARNKADDKRYDFLIDSLEGMHTLKAFCLEDPFTRRYEWIEKQSALINYRTAKASAAGFNAANVFAHLMSLTIIAFGAIRVMQGDMTSGALIATTLLAGRMMQPTQRALGLWVRYQDYQLARQKAQSLFTIPLTRRKICREPARAGNVALKDLAFSHGLEKGENFRLVNLEVRPGETVRISGDLTAGKTHLLGMMAGLYIPDDGKVLIDGLDPLSYPAGTLRRHVGLLKTKGEVFRGTVRDNLTSFGAVPEEDARRTTKLLGIEREIARLPRGFDTIIGDNETAAISPGLQQRIAIARVLAWNPGVVLFDNADRNLDRNGYRAVYRLLVHMKGHKALIMVTEDPHFMALADRNLKLGTDGFEPILTAAAKAASVPARIMENLS